MRITFGALNKISSDGDKVDVLRSLVRTFINDPKDIYILQAESSSLFFEFEHDQENGVPRRLFEATCQLNKDTLEVDKLSVRERIVSDEGHAEIHDFFKLDFTAGDAQLNSSKRKASPMETGLRKRLTHDNTEGADAEYETDDLDAEGETDDENSTNMPTASEPSGQAAFVLPDGLKLADDIQKHIVALQEELDADPTKSLEDKKAGPSFTALFKQIQQEEKYAYLRDSIRSRDRLLDTYRANLAKLNKPLLLKAMLADAVSYLGHIGEAKKMLSQLDERCFHRFLNAFYPDSPARKKIAELLKKPESGGNLKITQSKEREYLNIGILIDAHLAEQGLCFDDVCRIANEEKSSRANLERRRRFLAMSAEIMATNPKNPTYKRMLRILRVELHPEDQDTDLKELIRNAKFDDGEPQTLGNITAWQRFTPVLGEVLADYNVSVQALVLGVRAFAKSSEAGKTSLENFQDAQSPFANSTLNYAAIIEKVGPSAFDNMLRYILSNKCTEDILKAKSDKQG